MASACAAQDVALVASPPSIDAAGDASGAYAEDVDVAASAAAMDEIAARVPDPDWYPDGYRDIAIAARTFHADELADLPPLPPLPNPTAEEIAAFDASDARGLPPPGSMDLVSCDERDFAFDYSGSSSDVYARYGPVAFDVGYIDARLRHAGYLPEHYTDALLAFERARFGIFDKQAADPDYANWDEVSAAYWQLAEAVDTVRVEQELDLPPVYADGGCGAGGEPPVRIVTSPARGQVWLINAFAFKVCTRTMRDPWNTDACRWNEMETGKDVNLGGRYMYKVRWPDGTIRKGAREIYASYDEDGAATRVTFRRTGS